MDARTILNVLKSTPFKFTEASKFRDKLKKMEYEDRAKILSQIRVSPEYNVKSPTQRALKEMISDLL